MCHWFYRPRSKEVYRRCAEGWQVYTSTRGTARAGGTFQPTTHYLQALPGQSKPATISTHTRDNKVTLCSYSSHRVTLPAREIAPTNLRERIEALDEPSQWAVSTVDLGPGDPSDQGTDVAASIVQRRCKAVTDGSYKDSHGTAAFIIKGIDQRKAIRGCNVTPGQPTEQCAYRSELGGIIGILTTLEEVCALHSITEGMATIGCDCESAIKKLTSHRSPSPTASHYDMLIDARARIKELPIELKFKHVEGHQDSKNQGHKLALDWWALQNIAMDAKAKAHWRATKSSTPPNHKLKHELYSVLLAGTKLSSFDKTTVHAATNEKPIRDYWLKKREVFPDPTIFDDINWKAAQAAHREQPLGRRRWQAKFMTSHCATGKMMKIRRQWPHSKCPRCGQEGEDTRHICQCPDPDARALMN